MHFNLSDIEISPVNTNTISDAGITLSVARLDRVHPVVSGNKIYKLTGYLEEALLQKKKRLISFGGPYSNHLAALAYCAESLGLQSVGLVRGPAYPDKTTTLEQCIQRGMSIQYIERNEYRSFQWPESKSFPLTEDDYLIPEGGFGRLGLEGLSILFETEPIQNATHICVPVGTATTVAGILAVASQDQNIIAVPVLKNLADLPQRLHYLIPASNHKPVIWTDAHQGGFGKISPALVRWMNDFYQATQIPTDLVYTGKMMMAVMEKIQLGYFPQGSRVICLHTGGLQGNQSQPAGTFIF